jgi:hypothetical protein
VGETRLRLGRLGVGEMRRSRRNSRVGSLVRRSVGSRGRSILRANSWDGIRFCYGEWWVWRDVPVSWGTESDSWTASLVPFVC